MEFEEVSYTFENEQQFWDELDDTISKDFQDHNLIDNALRSYLRLTTKFRGEYINSDYDVARCTFKLHSSPLFEKHSDYIRRQVVHCLLQDDEPNVQRVAASFLLADAREDESTFELLNKEGGFCRLVDLVSQPLRDEEAGLHRLLMELLYEMSRIQKITTDDLLHVADEFIMHLFQIIEQISDDVHDPYHYPIIRVLLVLNEQFMVAAHEPISPVSSSVALTNKVIKVLSSHGGSYKSFGENIILLLNREDETSLQLLTLKLLYLLFTTPQTYEYFYTNDLRVLVDILIRNLLDLPEEASALRHTYLRVLYPLLAHTQLRYPPQYKRDEIRKLLGVLARGQPVDAPNSTPAGVQWGHFEEVDDTTKRLVSRCQKVTWLADPELEAIVHTESPVEDRNSRPGSPVSPVKNAPPALPAPRKLTKRKSSTGSSIPMGPYLRPQLEAARKSSLSMMEMAAQRERPGVITPSRNSALKDGLKAAILGKNLKEKPPLPQARRSTWARDKEEWRPENAAEISKTGVEEQKTKFKDKAGEEVKPTETAQEYAAATSAQQTEMAAVVKTSTSPKKPPPAPKTRRWRGKQTKEDGEGGGRGSREPGKFSAVLPSIVTTAPAMEEKMKKHQSPFSPIEEKKQSPFSPVEEKTLTTSPPPAGGMPKASVKSALGDAQAEAINGIRETLEKTSLQGSETETGADVEAEQHQQISPSPLGVLAPPGSAPERGVPGPRWEMERSPFLSDHEELSGEESG